MASGVNNKRIVMRKYKDNQLFKEVLYFLLNPYITTNINKSLDTTSDYEVYDIEYNDDFLRKLLDFLTNHCRGRKADLDICKTWCRNAPSYLVPFIEGLIRKDLKIGVDAITANRIFGYDFIPTFNVMLAKKYFDNPEKVDGKEFTITEKLDGCRAILIKENGVVKCFSRQGQEITRLIDIEYELKTCQLDNFALDGELLSFEKNISSDEQYKLTMQRSRVKGDKTGLTYRVFDVMPIDEFKARRSTQAYTERRKFIEENFSDFTYTKVVPVLYSGNDTTQITKLLREMTVAGREGVMVNMNDATYEFKRTDKLLKAKVMKDADLRVTGVFGGDGAYKGMLGGVVVEFEYNGKLYKSKCGSGFTKEEREMYWETPELVVNKIATIQYFEISRNKSGGYGLRFPVWIGRIRNDKLEISMY